MTAGSYGSMRATDADRDSVHSLLQAAYADGRLMQAKTYDQLGALTADLRQPVPYRQGPYPAAGPRTNSMAIASLACGIGQIFFWFIAGVPAIVFGHVARRQIRESGEAGDGMALAGLILGYIGVIGPLIAIITGLFFLAGP
jgi:hypothetical protein